jgi:hypothetical protein
MRRYRPGNIYGDDLQAELELRGISRKKAQKLQKEIQLNSKSLFVLMCLFVAC